MVAGQLDRARVAQEVRGVEEVDVQRVALDPLAAVSSRRRARTGGSTSMPNSVLERVDGAHLVGDRADAADARRRCRGPRRASGPRPAARSSAAPRRSRGCASTTSPSRTTRRSEPSPSTRVRPSTSKRWVFGRRRSWSSVIARSSDACSGAAVAAGAAPGGPPWASTTDAERLGAHTVNPANRAATSACRRSPRAPADEPGDVGVAARAEAAVAAAPIGRAQRAAAGPGDRPEARHRPARRRRTSRRARLHSAQTDFVGQLRAAADDERRQQLEQLARVDRAAAQLGVHDDVIGDRRGGRERVDELGPRIDGGAPTARDRDQLRSAWMPPAVAQAPIVTRVVARGAQAEQLLELLVRADRALDEEDVERSGRAARGRLGELDDVEPLGDREQVVLEVEDVSWQPSHEANLTTPTRGRRGAARRAGRRHQGPPS